MPPLDVNLESLINGLDGELAEADVLTKVSEARARARGLAELGDQLVDHYVGQARAEGASWTQIGDAMGVSKQAAQQRSGGDAFGRYTLRARQVIVAAVAHAREWDSPQVTTLHVLLGILDEEEGIGAKVIALLAGSLDTARTAVTAVLERGEGSPSGHIPFSAAVKRVHEETSGIAHDLGHNYVGTEHLLLGLLRHGDDPAGTALAGLGITEARAREAVNAALMGYQHRTKRG
jgi:hypothetical protein